MKKIETENYYYKKGSKDREQIPAKIYEVDGGYVAAIGKNIVACKGYYPARQVISKAGYSIIKSERADELFPETDLEFLSILAAGIA